MRSQLNLPFYVADVVYCLQYPILNLTILFSNHVFVLVLLSGSMVSTNWQMPILYTFKFVNIGSKYILTSSFTDRLSLYRCFYYFFRKMSDNIPLSTQRSCTEDERYVLDIFSYVQPARLGNSESLKQLILYITRALDNSKRKAFIQVWCLLIFPRMKNEWSSEYQSYYWNAAT